MRGTKRLLSLFTLCSVILLTNYSCVPDNTIYNPILSANNERDLGNALYDVALQNPAEFPLLDRNEYVAAYNYLEEVMRMVEVKTEIRGKYDWEILIINDDDVKNAFTFPGGKIFITTGFLRFINSEYELFALVAHEAYYADRIDQNSSGSLSLAMQKLRNSEKYSSSGSKIFLNVINGISDEGLEMATITEEATYEPFEVLSADEFSLRMICENYLYRGFGIKNFIIRVEDNEDIIEFAWFENKPPLPNTLANAGTSVTGPYRNDRVEQIELMASVENCGSENITQNQDAYMNFVTNDLP
ncbi:MAG: hypothetical protein ACI94Y_002828 [Maribacter sp.]|jgi:hypothetical protein